MKEENFDEENTANFANASIIPCKKNTRSILRQPLIVYEVSWRAKNHRCHLMEVWYWWHQNESETKREIGSSQLLISLWFPKDTIILSLPFPNNFTYILLWLFLLYWHWNDFFDAEHVSFTSPYNAMKIDYENNSKYWFILINWWYLIKCHA